MKNEAWEQGLDAIAITMIEVNGTSVEIKNQPKLKLEYEVTNLIVAPGEYLQVILEADNFKKNEKRWLATAFH